MTEKTMTEKTMTEKTMTEKTMSKQRDTEKIDTEKTATEEAASGTMKETMMKETMMEKARRTVAELLARAEWDQDSDYAAAFALFIASVHKSDCCSVQASCGSNPSDTARQISPARMRSSSSSSVRPRSHPA